MPFTLVAFNEARAVATAIAPVTATPDDHVQGAGDDIYVPKLSNLIGEYAGAGITAGVATPTQAYLDSPSLRRTTRHELPILDSFVTAPLHDAPQIHPLSPIPLDEGEALNAYLANTAVIALGRGMVGAWLADGPIAPVRGDIRTILCTSVVVGTLGVWSSGALTLAYDLPTGRYQLVGARCLAGATSQLFRFIFVEQWERPGGVSARVIEDHDMDLFRKGNLGVWGEFDQRSLPRLEVLNVETVANPNVYLDLIKVA